MSLLVAAAVASVLALWNWLVASNIYEWSTDPKNTYLFIAKRMSPQLLRRDFPFEDDQVFRFYQPLYMGVAVRLARWFDGIIPATRVLHFAFTFTYLLGWIVLGRRLGASWPAVLLFLAALVPYVPVTSADGIGVGAPGTWWSRSMANAFVPWFAVLAQIYFGGSGILLWGSIMVGALLFVHPVVAIGLLPAFACLPVVDYAVSGRLPGGEALVGVGALALAGVAFVRVYLRGSAAVESPSVDWDRVNALAFRRFRLWPYALIPRAERFEGLNRALHLTIGCAYLGAVALVLLAPASSQAITYHWMILLNFGLLVFLHIPPGEGSGVRIAVLAALGAAHMALNGSLWVSGVLVLLILSRVCLRRWLLAASIVATACLLFAGPASGAFRASPFEWWLTLAVPAVFLWYFAGCLVTFDLLPLRLHRPLRIIDWGRTAKIVQLPMYCWVLSLAQDVVSARSLVLGGLLLAAVLVNPLTAYRRFLDPEDAALFEWVKRTDADAVFHVASSDIWFGFDFRANTLRAITGSWKDGGICHYSSVERFFDWDMRMQLMEESVRLRKTSAFLRDGRRYGADFVVIDRRLTPEQDAREQVVFSNDRWQVQAVQNG